MMMYDDKVVFGCFLKSKLRNLELIRPDQIARNLERLKIYKINLSAPF
jgi:hypothetical protein